MTILNASNKIKTSNGYTILHRSRYHNHIALKEGRIYIYDNSGRDPEETKRIKEIRVERKTNCSWYSTLCSIEQGRIEG